MTLILSPRIEAKLTTAARRRGIEPSALIEQIVDEQFPTTEEEAAPELSEKSKALIALMREWRANTPTDLDEIRKAEADRDEFIENLNQNRIDSGERPLFP